MTVTVQPAYKVAFDIIDAGYKEWSFGASGLVFIAAGIVLVMFHSALAPRWPEPLRRGFAWFFLLFSLLWTGCAVGSTYYEYAKLVSAVRSGQVQYVEGHVEQFVPMPHGGNAMESFTVQGKRFEYSDYVVTAGFNNTASHGGPIREGRSVRVTYVDDTIVRLEISE